MEATTDNETMTDDQAIERLLGGPIQDEAEEVEETEEAEEIDEAEEASDDEEDESSEDDETEAEAAAQDTNLIPVKIDGKTELWTLEQLRRSAAGQGYIQKQMREVAEAKKAAEENFVALQQQLQAVAQLQQQLASGNIPLTPPKPPARELLKTDPIGYMEQEAAYREQIQAYQVGMAQIQAVERQRAEISERQRQAKLADEAKLLAAAIPEFADNAKRQSIEAKMFRVAQDDYGLEPAELQSVADHRLVRILHDAVRYRELMAAKPQAEQKAAKAKPMIRPGAQQRPNPGADYQKKLAHAKRTQSDDAFVSLLLKRKPSGG